MRNSEIKQPMSPEGPGTETKEKSTQDILKAIEDASRQADQAAGVEPEQPEQPAEETVDNLRTIDTISAETQEEIRGSFAYYDCLNMLIQGEWTKEYLQKLADEEQQNDMLIDGQRTFTVLWNDIKDLKEQELRAKYEELKKIHEPKEKKEEKLKKARKAVEEGEKERTKELQARKEKLLEQRIKILKAYEKFGLVGGTVQERVEQEMPSEDDINTEGSIEQLDNWVDFMNALETDIEDEMAVLKEKAEEMLKEYEGRIDYQVERNFKLAELQKQAVALNLDKKIDSKKLQEIEKELSDFKTPDKIDLDLENFANWPDLKKQAEELLKTLNENQQKEAENQKIIHEIEENIKEARKKLGEAETEGEKSTGGEEEEATGAEPEVLEKKIEEVQKEFMQAKKDWGEYKTALWRIGGIFKRKEKNKVKQRYAQAKTNYEKTKKEYIEKGGDEAAGKIEVMEKFGDLGISMEELKEVEGFKELSVGRQALIAENLKQLALGRIQAEAPEEYRKETVDARFAARMWKGISKEYQIAKLQKVEAKKIMEGGMEVHKEVLQALVDRAKDGPEVKIQEDGTLEMQYVTSEDFEGFDLTKEQKDQINDFNEIATKFSKTPMEWRYEYEGKKIKGLESKKFKQYKKIEQNYEDARQEILNLKKKYEKAQMPPGRYATKEEPADLSQDQINALCDKEAFCYVNNIDRQVHLNQFLNNNPEVEKELKKIKNKKAWMAAMKSVATERGLYSAAGFITRTATISLLGIPAAPLAAGALAGWRARTRAKETLKEKEAATRKGEGEVKKKIEKINKQIEQAKEEGNEERRKQLEEERYKIRKESKAFIEADKLAEKLEGLQQKVKQLYAEKTPEEIQKEIENKQKEVEELKQKIQKAEGKEKEKLREGLSDLLEELRKLKVNESLQARIEYTQKKMEEGLVIYGKEDKERLNNQYELMQSFSEAAVLAETNTQKGKSALQERLEKFLGFREKKISQARKKYLWKQFGKGAGIGATFAIAGYGFRYLGEQFGWWEAIGEKMQKIPGVKGAKEFAGKTVKEIKETLGIGGEGAKKVTKEAVRKAGEGGVKEVPTEGIKGGVPPVTGKAGGSEYSTEQLELLKELARKQNRPLEDVLAEHRMATTIKVTKEGLKKLMGEKIPKLGQKTSEAVEKAKEVFTETVQKNEGYIHQARKAIAEYADKKGIKLNQAQRVKAEWDLWHNKTGGVEKIMQKGEKVKFTPEEIKKVLEGNEGVVKRFAQGTPQGEQLQENLKHYTGQVKWGRYQKISPNEWGWEKQDIEPVTPYDKALEQAKQSVQALVQSEAGEKGIKAVQKAQEKTLETLTNLNQETKKEIDIDKEQVEKAAKQTKELLKKTAEAIKEKLTPGQKARIDKILGIKDGLKEGAVEKLEKIKDSIKDTLPSKASGLDSSSVTEILANNQEAAAAAKYLSIDHIAEQIENTKLWAEGGRKDWFTKAITDMFHDKIAKPFLQTGEAKDKLAIIKIDGRGVTRKMVNYWIKQGKLTKIAKFKTALTETAKELGWGEKRGKLLNTLFDAYKDVKSSAK